MDNSARMPAPRGPGEVQVGGRWPVRCRIV